MRAPPELAPTAAAPAPHPTRTPLCAGSYHSWGGRPIFTPSDGKWHASLSFLCRHAGLGQWTTVSASGHFVADSPDGAYTWGPEQCTPAGICTPSVIPWSHNTVFLENPAEASSGARFQIWHVGDGVAPAADWDPCFNASEVGAQHSLARLAPQHQPPALRQPSPGNAAYVTYANSPAGPWTRGLGNGQVPINFTGSWTSALAGNPAPLVMPDGSVNLYFTAVPCPPNSGAKAANCIAVATSTSGFAGPFEMRAARHPITYPESEDPSVFRDKRGNYHLLTNVNTCHARCEALRRSGTGREAVCTVRSPPPPSLRSLPPPPALAAGARRELSAAGTPGRGTASSLATSPLAPLGQPLPLPMALCGATRTWSGRWCPWRPTA